MEAELATIETETRAAEGERRAVLGEAEAGRRELGRVRAALDSITGGNTDNTRYRVSFHLPMHSGATPLLRGFSRKNIFGQKIFDNFFSFQAT